MRLFSKSSPADFEADTSRTCNGGSDDRSLIVVAVTSVVLSGILVFGSPTLWMTSVESEALAAAAATEGEGNGSDDAESTIVPESTVIAEHQTFSQSEDSRRASNLALAAEAIDGCEIKPGQIFSFNEVVGDSGTDERYKIAAVVTDEGIAEERGGGVCQVSTALYLAALKADLTVTERHPHSMVVDYAPVGLDATVSFGIKDLKIRNDGQFSVFLRATAEGQSVTVQIIGQPLEAGLSIEPLATVVNLAERAGLIPDDGLEGDQDGDGYIDDAYIHPTTEYVTESYRVYYREGIKVEQEYLSTDTYREPVKTS